MIGVMSWLAMLTGCAEPWVGPEMPVEVLRCADYERPAEGGGDVYYVDGDSAAASDANDGRAPSRPWRTIQKAARALRAGETARIRAGTYREADITLRHSGAEGAPITLAAWGGEVVLDGAGLGAEAGILIDADWITLRGLTVQNMVYGVGTYTEDPAGRFEGIVLQGVVARDNDLVGVHLMAARGFALDGVEAYRNGADGIALMGPEESYTSHGWVVGARTYDNGPADGAHGLSINQGHTIAVCDSVAYGNTSHGFDVSDWPKRNPISYNITLEGNTAYDHRAQAGFSVNSDSTQVRLLRNVAYDNVVGFYCYEGCSDVTWAHNVATGNKHGFQVEDRPAVRVDTGSRALTFVNNISYANRWAEEDFAYPALEVEHRRYEVEARYNDLVEDSLASAAARVGRDDYQRDALDALGEGNRAVAPRFEDEAAGDFRLAPTSPLIDAGVEIAVDGADEPYAGDAPDVGAFEGY